MSRASRSIAIVLAVACVLSAAADQVIIDYKIDAGGNNQDPLNGLSARGTWQVSGDQLLILLENTSSGVPEGFEVSDSLLVSLGFNLGDIKIVSGDTAVIGARSIGMGKWADRGQGDSVAEEWLWTNDFGGDLMNDGERLARSQIISTSEGQGGGVETLFGGGDPDVSGPFGGMTANPPHRAIPGDQAAVRNTILFALTLSGDLSDEQLHAIAGGGVIEFGSDARYLVTPEPATLALLGLGALALRRRQ